MNQMKLMEMLNHLKLVLALAMKFVDPELTAFAAFRDGEPIVVADAKEE